MLPDAGGRQTRAVPRRDIALSAALSLLAATAACWRFGLTWPLLAYLGFAAVTGPLVVIDLREQRLPNVITLPLYPAMIVLLGLAALVDRDLASLLRALAAGGVLLAAFIVLHLVNPAGMGMGDVKLSGPMGMVLGWISWQAVWWGTLLGFVGAAVVSLVLLALRLATRKSALPFGPAMLAGTWAAICLSALSV